MNKLKTFYPLIFFAIIITALCCSTNPGDIQNHINCDGLVTDTTGTGDNGRVAVPNAFSPNGDGLNDIFRPIMQNISSFTLTIYEEDNSVVFQTSLPGDGWQPIGQYNISIKFYYKVQATTTSGHHIGVCGEVYALVCFPTSMPRSFFTFEDQWTPNGFTGVTSETMVNCN